MFSFRSSFIQNVQYWGLLQDPDREALLYISRHLFQHRGQRPFKHFRSTCLLFTTLQGPLKRCFSGNSTLQQLSWCFWAQRLCGASKLLRSLIMTHSIKLFRCKIYETPDENNYCTQLYYLLRRAGSFGNSLRRWSLGDAWYSQRVCACVRVRTSKTTGK